MSQTYWITRRDQVEALTSTVRHDIVDRLAALGPTSVRDLARALGRRPTSIYHHLKQMESLGLIRSVKSEGQRGRPAQIYEAVAPRVRLSRSPSIPENREPMVRAAAATTRQVAADYKAGFNAPNWSYEGPTRNHWFARVVASPSPERLAEINRRLDELAELIWAPDPNPGPPMTFAWYLSPLSPHRKGE